MANKTDICNLALSHLGVSISITDVDVDNTAASNACLEYFDFAVEKTLADSPWPFATKFAVLSEVAERPDPPDEWDFSYRYPADCLNMRRLLSGSRNDSRQSKVPYKIGRDSSGKLIYTDLEDAECEYTMTITDETEFSSGFVMALSAFLAALIVPRVTRGDVFEMARKMYALYDLFLTQEESRQSNEEVRDQLPYSEFERGR